jgi:cysteine desulfurase
VLFHCDAVQAVGKLPVNVRSLPMDFLSLTGHKIGAPKGIGALYVCKSVEFVPFIHGGHQERSRRGGTENVASIAGLGVAAAQAKKKPPGSMPSSPVTPCWTNGRASGNVFPPQTSHERVDQAPH